MDPDDKVSHLDELGALDLEALLDRLPSAPTDIDLLVEIGRRYLRQGDLNRTEEFYVRALALDENEPWTHMYMGNLHYTRRQYSKAIAHFERGAELLPGIPCAYWCLADVYAAMGRADLAESHYQKAVATDPNDQDARRRLHEWYESRYAPE